MEKTSFFVHDDGCNIRVRRGFAQIWCSDPFEPMVISGLSSNFGPVPPFPVLRFAFFILRFLFSVPCSSFLDFPARSPFLVGVTSYYCYDTTVVSSNSDFRKHISAMSVLKEKRSLNSQVYLRSKKVSDWYIPGRVYWRAAASPVSY